MSQIRTAKAADVGAFPGSKFVVDGSPPITQCQETKILIVNGSYPAGGLSFTKVAAFVGIDLTGKNLEITGPPPPIGDYAILSNTDDTLTLASAIPAAPGTANGEVADSGQAYLTRNESSFQRYIESQSKAHTTKGGQLYTDLADPPMDDACTDTWSPE